MLCQIGSKLVNKCLGCEVPVAVMMKFTTFSDTAPCSPYVNQHSIENNVSKLVSSSTDF
jgi:hypothetical protein